MNELDDKKLLELLKIPEKKEFVFTQLVKKYQKKLYWLIRRIVINHHDADEVLQNTFIKIWHNLPKFKEQSEIYTWMYRIATNEALSFIKQKKQWLFIPIQNIKDKLIQTIDNDIYICGDEIQKKMEKAILQLPNQQRIIFIMKYYEGLKYEEISKILNISVGALKASYHHAIKKIKKFFEIN